MTKRTNLPAEIAPQYRRERIEGVELTELPEGGSQIDVNIGHSIERWIVADGEAQIVAKLPVWQGPAAAWVRCA